MTYSPQIDYNIYAGQKMKESDYVDWLKQFNENYYGRSEQAKELEQFLKQNYQGSNYIPWASIERMVYQQDPAANFRIRIKDSDLGSDSSIVWTSKTDIVTYQKNQDKEIETLGQSIAHFIILELTFLGKTFEEIYPIQDNKYSAPKSIDQNMVNKAIQRAKAKLASRATGLGLTLYETGDLQFEEDDVKPSKPVEQKVQIEQKVQKREETPVEKPQKQEESKVETPKKTPSVKWTPEVVAFAGDIRGNDAYDVGLQKINHAIIKKYGFSLSREDKELEDKLMQIDNLSVFIRTLKTQSNIPV